MTKNCAIILAAGKGKRMGANINKIFLNLKDKPILYYTINAFEVHKYIGEIILVASKNEVKECKNLIEKYKFKKVLKIVEGGSERQNSVFNGLKAVNKDTDIVLIHDGARPFVTEDIISNGIKYANLYGIASCGVTPKDTIKVKNEEGFSMETLDRSKLINIQTPQCFKYNIIYSCHDKIKDTNISVTDDTSVTEYFGYKTFLYDGQYTNIKITTYEDMIFGENLIK